MPSIWTDPSTLPIATGEVVPASKWNTIIRDNELYLYNNGVLGGPGAFGFVSTVDPRVAQATRVIGAANSCQFGRVSGGNATITKIALHVGTASGNISAAVYDTTGSGRSAMPNNRLQTTGAVACPAAGYAEVALGAGQATSTASWLAVSVDNGTATFAVASSATLIGTLAKGLEAFLASGAHPAPATAAGATAQSSGNGSLCLVGVP